MHTDIRALVATLDNLPIYISLIFGLTTLLTIYLFYRATNNSRVSLLVVVAWFLFQAVVGLSGFYTTTDTLPPRFLLQAAPPLLLISGLFLTQRGKQYVDSLDTRLLTILHTVRIPVEIVLFLLFIYKAVPEIMTFEGRNFDILAGLTAPLIFYFGYVKDWIDRSGILIWNFVCLGLLINIIIIGVLSSPFPFQQFGFDQPNIALVNFPFVWLASTIVPIVMFSHLATIRQWLRTPSTLIVRKD